MLLRMGTTVVNDGDAGLEWLTYEVVEVSRPTIISSSSGLLNTRSFELYPVTLGLVDITGRSGWMISMVYPLVVHSSFIVTQLVHH